MTNFDAPKPREANITIKYVEGWVKEEDGTHSVLKVPFCRTYTLNNTGDTDESLRLRLFRMITRRVGQSSEPLLSRLYAVDMVAFHETGDAMSGEWQCDGDESVFIETLKGKRNRNRKVDADSEE